MLRMLLGILICPVTWADPPYPPSPVIEKIVWAPADSIVRKARGSDNLPITWADDNSLYITWGDGWGFNPKLPKKLSMGFARILGGPEDFKGINIRSTAEQLGGGRSGRKGWGLISVGGVLYLWMGHADQQGGQAQLAWSHDHARTWTFADWRFSDFGLMGFVNFGKDNELARDDYVYAYSHDGPLADTLADRGDTRFAGGFAVYDAPEPWGPWSTAFYTEKWDVGPGEHGDFPAKWMTADGRELYLVFSGDDSFSVRKASIVLRQGN